MSWTLWAFWLSSEISEKLSRTFGEFVISENLVKIVADILRICLRLRLGKVCRGHSEVSQREEVVPKRVK